MTRRRGLALDPAVICPGLVATLARHPELREASPIAEALNSGVRESA